MLSSTPELWFDAEAVSKELRSNKTSATNHLNNLLDHGLLIKNENLYKYQPKNQELKNKVTALYHAYHERPVAVVTCIFDKPSDKLKEFADAFKFKKD